MDLNFEFQSPYPISKASYMVGDTSDGELDLAPVMYSLELLKQAPDIKVQPDSILETFSELFGSKPKGWLTF